MNRARRPPPGVPLRSTGVGGGGDGGGMPATAARLHHVRVHLADVVVELNLLTDEAYALVHDVDDGRRDRARVAAGDVAEAWQVAIRAYTRVRDLVLAVDPTLEAGPDVPAPW